MSAAIFNKINSMRNDLLNNAAEVDYGLPKGPEESLNVEGIPSPYADTQSVKRFKKTVITGGNKTGVSGVESQYADEIPESFDNPNKGIILLGILVVIIMMAK